MKILVDKEKISNFIYTHYLRKSTFCKECYINLTTLNNILQTGTANALTLFKMARAMKTNIASLSIYN